MTTRTENEVRIFNEAINKCRMPVFLVSSDGTEYNMKSADQNKAGMARWIKDSNNEMEYGVTVTATITFFEHTGLAE